MMDDEMNGYVSVRDTPLGLVGEHANTEDPAAARAARILAKAKELLDSRPAQAREHEEWRGGVDRRDQQTKAGSSEAHRRSQRA